MPRITIYFSSLLAALGSIIIWLGACGDTDGSHVDVEAFCIENCENWVDCHGEEDQTQRECEADCKRDLESLQRSADDDCQEAIQKATDCFLEMSCDEMLERRTACGDELQGLDEHCEG